MISLKDMLQKCFPFLILTMQKLRGEVVLTADVLIKLSKLYNVSTDYILGLTDHPHKINFKK